MPLLRWLSLSSLFAIAGVLGLAYLATRIAVWSGADGGVRERQIAVVIWAQVVLVKALLPHVWITIAVCRMFEGPLFGRPLAGRPWIEGPLLEAPLLESQLGQRTKSAGRLVLMVLGVAAVTSVAVVTLVLTADLPGLPSVKVHGVAKIARTCLELTAATSLAVGLPRWWVHVMRRRARAGRAAGSSQPV